jgi:hypothetical protein
LTTSRIADGHSPPQIFGGFGAGESASIVGRERGRSALHDWYGLDEFQAVYDMFADAGTTGALKVLLTRN